MANQRFNVFTSTCNIFGLTEIANIERTTTTCITSVNCCNKCSKGYRKGHDDVMQTQQQQQQPQLACNKIKMFSVYFLIVCVFLSRGAIALAAVNNNNNHIAQSTIMDVFKTHYSNNNSNSNSNSNTRIKEPPLALSQVVNVPFDINNMIVNLTDTFDYVQNQNQTNDITNDYSNNNKYIYTNGDIKSKNVFEDLLDSFRTYNLPQEPIYTNEFAVHIPAGKDIADIVASKHGFINLGQVGSLKDYYIFYHHHVSKRSLRVSSTHHSLLNSEPEVRWMQQQHEKVRQKRDGSHSELLNDNPFDVLRASNAYRDHRVVSRIPRTQYRDPRAHNVFPDPLFKEQWYLNGGAKDGLDMNVGPAWQKGYTGKGVVVSILDDGIQTNHPDLAQNYDPDASFDINGNDSDPTPQDNGDNKHGTRCAGEVAAVAFNNFCGVGIAYNASIGGVRMLDGKVNDVVEAQALSLNPSHIDIYSASWGPEDDGSTVDGPGPLARRAFIYGVTSGRQGKGSIFVWASGNGGRYTDSCNCDGYTNSIFTLSISSATQAGFKPWYLEECSSTLATTYSSGTPGHDKSVATVDMDGRLRSDHICTVEHTGTSASAPLAAGICALALEANPNLTWRDMQFLVVYTSRPEPLEKEAGWVMNGVKRKYSHKFGYGLMDAGAMVNLAEQWLTVPPQHICKSRENNEDLKIEGAYGYTLVTHMDVNGCAGTINEVRYLEHVQCRITLRFFPRGNLRIVLTSPMGTTSTLLFERPRDIVKSNFDDWPFLSVHYWGEKAEGRWTLQVINGGRRRVNQPGILSKWQLIFYGTSEQPTRLKSELVDKTMLRPNINPYIFSPSSDLGQPSSEGIFYNNDQYGGYVNYQNLFTGAGSSPEQVVATVDDEQLIAATQGKNLNAPTKTKILQHDCDVECDAKGCYGSGPTQCITCKNYRLDNACVVRCPTRYFPSKLGDCWPCHESCATCAGASEDTCLSCAPAHLHVSDLAVCLRNCLDGYYESNNTCIPCEPNCASCQNESNHCTRCDHHLVMHNNKCHTSCPPNTYETEDNSCSACHASCKTCNSSSESSCISCHPGRFAHEGKCLNTCPIGYYADKKRQECVSCPVGCSTCSTNGFCQTCNDGWSLNKKEKCILTGWENCKESEYYDNNQCYLCHPTCRTCDGPTMNNCLSCASNLLLQKRSCVKSCDDGYFLDAGACESCLHTCTHCNSRLNCTECAAGLQLQHGECQINCADGYYSDRGVCTKCFNSCQTCSGPRSDQCLKCYGNWQLAGGECHPECPNGFYKTAYGCQKCHHYCKTCNGTGPLACTSCAMNYMFDGGLCMKCLRSEYYDLPTQTCKACHSTCRSCYGPGPYSCKTCELPQHLDRLNNQCVPCCVNDVDSEQCCHCDKQTGECMNVSSSGKRRTAPPNGQMSSFSDSDVLEYDDALDSSVKGFYVQERSSSLLTTSAIAIVACVFAVLIFSVIFAVLQQKTKKFDCKVEKHCNREKLRNPCIDAEANLMSNEYNDAEDCRNDNLKSIKHFDGICKVPRPQRTTITSDNSNDDEELYESNASTPLMKMSSEYFVSKPTF